ncbi:MAG: FAD-dependent oxidoreductase [candidate division KSB1 bacterium]|nr:FAD-dependent oxidoreductase [candidate division KSB1 bacterium]MDZ7303085.1 FAD-dependent oxidoreductase [candidate division KSB1 bacterium]MDZ7312624.1 FAD-dependent oxidoreductase [candidate division KSB1 bacterium]
MSEKYPVRIPDIEFWKSLVPCQIGCPVHTDAGRYVQLIAEQKYKEAYLTSRSPNPFASVCGRVCAAPCEDRCRRGQIDAPVSIRALKRFVTEKYGVESLAPDTQDGLFEGSEEAGNKWRWHLPVQIQSRKNVAKKRQIAIIGSGPAGLSCAHDLALMGYHVTVFEATNVAGGMLRHGIPEYRLSRSLIDKEIDKIKNLGVEIRYNTALGEKFGIAELKQQGYEAIFISVGTQKGRDLNIEGSQLDGVIKAIDYLININNGYRVNLGKKVLVIGGGFVAFDAARMALRGGPEEEPADIHSAVDAARVAMRAGASEVHIASLESFAEMPVLRTAQGHEEFEEAQREGIVFHPQRGPKRFFGDNGKVKAVEFIGVKRTYDENGRFNPVYDPSYSEIFETDSVILAIGQQADLSFIKSSDGIELTPSKFIKIDPETLATSAPGIYAGGDVAFGPRNIIDAIANGKRAALSIDEYLRDAKLRTFYNLSIEKIPTRRFTRPEDFEQYERQAPPTINLQRRTGISEVETGYNEEQARRQAERCLACHIQTIYDAGKCVMCNRCVDICPEYCLKLVPLEQLDVDEATREKLVQQYNLDPFQPASAMLKDDDTCIRCGLCAIRCPTDAMTMEVFYYEEQEVA